MPRCPPRRVAPLVLHSGGPPPLLRSTRRGGAAVVTPVRVCHWCHGDVVDAQVTVTDTSVDSTTINDWILCSWACAHELVVRMLRSGR